MSPNSPTDAELVAETLAGNRESFGRLYDRHARLAAAVVAGVSSDWPAVDDMVQECFLRAYRKLETLREPAKFQSWLTGIARQVARERRRSLRRDRHEFRDARSWEPDATTTPCTTDLRDEFELVMQRIAELDEDERVAIHAFYLEQQNADRTAELLGISRSGAYALLQRALAHLASQLRPHEHQEKK
jgi:RNA polymerase sigma-70 factor (ECF subfamily)